MAHRSRLGFSASGQDGLAKTLSDTSTHGTEFDGQRQASSSRASLFSGSHAGNRRINRVLHILAITQLRSDTEGRRYDNRKLTAGKTPKAPLRTLSAHHVGRWFDRRDSD